MPFRYLLRNWLQQAARQKLQETVVEAARRELHQTPASQEASAGQPCPVGLVFALNIESGGLEDLLSEIVTTRGAGFVAKRGLLQDRPTVLVEAGAGLKAAARATGAVIDGLRPAWIVSAGFAGGLASQIRRHDIVVADSLIDAAGTIQPLELLVPPAELRQLPGVHVGRLLTVDQVLRSPAEKQVWGQRTGAVAVDMESTAVAAVCREHQVGFLAVRIITDPWDEQLPEDIEKLVRQKTSMSRFGAAVGAALNRPGSVKDMYRLRENSLLASDRLARFFAALLPRLTAGK